MSTRKQSIPSTSIVISAQDSKLPSAGAPPVQNIEYDPDPVVSLGEEDTEEEAVAEVELVPPTNISVVEQRITFSDDGTQFVTVVIEFDEVQNAEYYETRVAKT